MPLSDGSEDINDDEILFRRIPVSKGWYSESDNYVMSEAFAPIKLDVTGLSLTRAKYISSEEVGKSGSSKLGYFVVQLRAGDLRRANIRIFPKPEPGNPGHCELPDLRFDIADTEAAEVIKEKLSNHCLKVEGPFKKDY